MVFMAIHSGDFSKCVPSWLASSKSTVRLFVLSFHRLEKALEVRRQRQQLRKTRKETRDKSTQKREAKVESKSNILEDTDPNEIGVGEISAIATSPLGGDGQRVQSAENTVASKVILPSTSDVSNISSPSKSVASSPPSSSPPTYPT